MKTMNITIAGAFTHNLIPSLLKLRRLGDVTVYDGPNNCSWNAGRINRDIYISKKDIQKYNKIGVRVALTFSNPNIDLRDKVGLDLLKMLESRTIQNEIILTSEPFRIFLREFYDFLLKFSITGHDLQAYPNVSKQEEYKKYYKDLESKYDIIVPKMEHVFQEWFYTSINIEKYEIMTNDTCRPDCQFYKQHFEEIARINTIFKNEKSAYEYNKVLAESVEECWLPNFDPNKELTSCSTGMDLDKELIKQAKELGYSRFKISGRENTVQEVLKDLECLET